MGGGVCAWTLFLFHIQVQIPIAMLSLSGTELGRGGIGLFDGHVLRPRKADRCHRNEGVPNHCWRLTLNLRVL